ncbi:SpdD protein [Streptomyces sp. NPDC041003]|uniref:SpdD protein n=1 Tax=Streptomyces sp. NPDC041003 TaxID=3155730 RepID=UPI003409C454
MFKPKYPSPDTYTPATIRPTPAPVEHHSATPALVKAPTSLGGLVQHSPGTTLVLAAGAAVGILALASVAVSLLLAVAVTAVALSISAVVLLFLVRALRQEFKSR